MYRRKFCALVAMVFREIFDETAYSRFLARRNVTPSRESYAEFIQEQSQSKARLPRCC